MFGDAMRELDSGVWAELNLQACPCRGRGWLHSDFDTYHRCPVHGAGVPHPEDEEAEFDWAAHYLRMQRASWRAAQRRSGLDRGAFRSRVEAAVAGPNPTPTDWVETAWIIAEDLWREQADRDARRLGYSCRLEAAWASEADVERRARAAHLDPDEYAPRGSPLRCDADRWY